MIPSQSFINPGGKIRATAHRLSQDDLGAMLFHQPLRMDRKLVKAAAETAASNFFCRNSAAAHESGIDQLMPLIVGDDADPEAAFDQTLCGLDDGCCLPAAQETADTGNPGF
jgi:hypothetical protein